MKLSDRSRKWLAKKMKRGIVGYPAGTLAFYGPDDRTASKAVASIVLDGEGGAGEMRKWFADPGAGDLRTHAAVLDEIAAFFKRHGVGSIGALDRIIGCPHEEAIDYPEGVDCPQCPFWAGVDRWTGKPLPDLRPSKAQLLAQVTLQGWVSEKAGGDA